MNDWTAKTAEWYAEKYGEYPTNRITIEQLDLTPDATIVDIGCGTGSALRHASKKVTTGSLIGIDPIPRMIEIAKERLVKHPAASRIHLHVAPVHSLPVDDNSADFVLALDSYDHWEPHQREGLAEVRRILAPGGQFIVVKDNSVPYAKKAKKAFLASLDAEGIRVVDERKTETDDVSFTTWICSLI